MGTYFMFKGSRNNNNKTTKISRGGSEDSLGLYKVKKEKLFNRYLTKQRIYLFDLNYQYVNQNKG